MTSLPFDRVAHEYDETRGGEPRGRAMAEAILPHLGGDGPVLDVGVGTGVVALGLSRLGRTVVGVDLSEPMLRRARDRGVPVVQGDALRLPVRDASVDDAYAAWVLHLVADIGATLGEIARVLRPGGRCLVATPDQGQVEEDDQVGLLFRRMWDALRGPRPDHPGAIRAAAGENGLAYAAELVVDGGEFEESPADIADRIERRTYSVLWDVDDERWREHVAPVVAELRALPGVTRTKRYRIMLIVLEKQEGPGA